MVDIKINYIPKEEEDKPWGVTLTWKSSISRQYHGLGDKQKSEPTVEDVIAVINTLLQESEKITKEEPTNVKSY